MNDQETPLSDVPTSTTGEDWEARFKGLQRKYNQEVPSKDAEIERLRADLEAVRATNQNLQRTNSELQNAVNSEKIQRETSLSELQAQLAQLQEQSTALASEKEQLEAAVAKHGKEREFRQVLINPEGEYTDLLPFFEAGLLDKALDLEGEARDEYLKTFMGTLTGKFKQSYEKNLDGSMPPPPQSATNRSASSTLRTYDDFINWLSDPRNLDSPERAIVQQQFDNLPEE